MWFVMLLTVWASYEFVKERFPIEVTSVGLLTALLVFGQLFPVLDANGHNELDAKLLLVGFANPALVAVLALLVMGQAIVRTDALRPVTNLFVKTDKKWVWVSIFFILAFVLVFSAFMNNTPLVILAIPILQALAVSAGVAESRILMPLSFAAILGGMTTLVGSSTNLLVSGALVELGYKPLGFFDFLVPGSILAGVGFIYVIFIMPRMMPDRSSLKEQLVGNEKEFIAELDIAEDSELVGMECSNGEFPKLEDLKIRMIQRLGHIVLPPFEGYVLQPGDILIVAATRKSLADILSRHPGFLLSEEEAELISTAKKPSEPVLEGEEEEVVQPNLDEQVERARTLAEIMITPGSRFLDMSLEQIGLHRQYGAIVLGIQRRARVVRRRLGRIRMESGDVLLIAGSQASINSMRGNRDFIVLSGSKKDLPVPKKAPLAGFIMLSAISLAAFGIMSIPVAAITGAAIMIATDCLNVRQATRAIDRKIFLLVGTMLALGHALQVTEGASFIAEGLLNIPFVETPFAMASLVFLVVAICTNILSNNACAILFTPIAVNIGLNVGVDPLIFAVTILFAANCSFASPIGYKTNLLVMGPGAYRFRDFLKGGIPLLLLIWVTYMVLAKFYYQL